MEIICKNCGHIGSPEQKLKGHILITIILLICWIIPGLIYMIWRRSGLKNTCTSCGSENIVRTDSAAGQTALHDIPTPRTHVKCPDCRELVRKDASKCKHCQAVLVPSPIEEEIVVTSGAENVGKAFGKLFAKKK